MTMLVGCYQVSCDVHHNHIDAVSNCCPHPVSGDIGIAARSNASNVKIRTVFFESPVAFSLGYASTVHSVLQVVRHHPLPRALCTAVAGSDRDMWMRRVVDCVTNNPLCVVDFFLHSTKTPQPLL